jgi:D-alanyl-lipoteichoic acid acyltransferase DltB (MBOAT superfamily)
LFLLIFSTLLDFYSAKKISGSTSQANKKFWLFLCICINLGFLGVFKYYNFFISSFADSISYFGYKPNIWTFKIILPIGISFYTFHGLSYIIDNYKGRITAEKNFVDYAVFVSFFPLLVAGPIERATHLLPQIKKKRQFSNNQSVDGLCQILWGLFKKIVIADNCAEYVNTIFSNSATYSGSTLVVGALFFAFQIYCDFSGYSDIAIGSAKLFGIDLLKNFAFPYFSRSIAEFWRRWHISLSSWFKDYLYIPLGGSRVGTWKKVRNTFIIFLVSGFWHGANWTFLLWGFLHALYIMPSILFETNRSNLDIVAKGKLLPTLTELLAMIATFALTTFAWIFFRSDNIAFAFSYISKICSPTLFSMPQLLPVNLIILIIGFMFLEWLGREQEYGLKISNRIDSKLLRIAGYYAIALLILIFGNFSSNQFIYFQF